MSHVKIEDIDVNQLKIAKSSRTVTLRYNNLPFQLATCKLYSPFGVKGTNSDYSPFTNWTIDCSIDQNNSDASQLYQTNIDLLDTRLIELIKESCNSFNPRNMEEVDLTGDFYSPILRNNKTWPKLMKISVPRDTKGNLLSVIFDENTEKIPITDKNIEQILCKGKVFKAIIEFSKFWIYKGRIGTTWHLIQMKLISKTTKDKEPEDTEAPNASIYTNNLMLDDN